ncbi:hypothetical protein [Petrotoga sp. 9PWA.NaAc.5.4]|uniref:hypothetical protein n=1 Tax=Petrotoga sp. 9PWA.NaAc.5.4 TaxID=1434328 RepID=UPI000CC8065F|nr:hypothetical protein X924_06475 [Petrotoga sp. 9PWA.NaAc.5.4]
MVGEDSDSLDEPSEQSLVKFRDVGFLLTNEVLQFFDPVHGFFTALAVDLGLFFLIPKLEDLVNDGVVVQLVTSFLDELLLKFLQSCQNSFHLVKWRRALTTALTMFSCRVLKNSLEKRDIGSDMNLPKIRTGTGPKFVSKIFEETVEKLGMIHERIPDGFYGAFISNGMRIKEFSAKCPKLVG